ncbi:hypothetical protein G9A89_000666, partial [Geosiphon pyriformis]
PFGNLIASSQKLHHRHDICFFEKNGLRHGYFTLREKEKHRVIDLLWNCDSSILALLLGRKEYNSQVVHVQLWSISNYHWYLKQEILPVLSKSIISIFWDNEIPLRLHYITEDGYYCHDYVWDTLTANKISKENAATVAVIDGSSLLVTPFRYINIPPPMCAFDIPLDRPAVDVSFSMENHGNDFAVLLATNEISLFDWSSLFQGLPMKPPRLLGTFKPLGQETVVSLRQIIWINRKTVLCLESSPSCEDFIIKITLYFDEDGAPKIDSQIRCSTPGTILRLSTHTHLSEVFIESVEGSIYKVLFDQGIDQVNCIEIEPNPLIRFPECCEYISSTSLGNEGSTNLLFIGLSKGNKLYANDIILAADCTSFFIHNDFLVFTTSNQNVRFISLHLELSEFKPSEAIVEAFDESRRRVERGAKIIIASHFDVSLVLQMPRGNLETIYPRAFVLGAVRQYIDRLEYRSAFMICRKHKLDFNILYDHAPESFLEHIQEFVAQVSEVEYLNLFLSNIRNQDVTHSLYPQLSRLSSHKIREPLNSPGKVNIICDTIRVVLEEVDQRRYIQSILTTYIQKTPPDLEAALNLLIQLKAQDHDFAESALKFTTFLIDPEKLYDVALGLYDFSLVLMVAQQSQRDPREYLPFLTELQSHEKYYQRFKIDDYLKRFEKALKNLSLADDKHLDFCFEYIRKHQLYKAALRIFSKNPEKHKIVVSMYADHLFQDSKFQEAGLAYALAEKPVDALEAFKKACLWRDALVIAQQLKFSKEDLYKLAIELSELLGEKRLFHDAAQVLLDYTEELEEAVGFLAQAYMWKEAERICYLHSREDLVVSLLRPSILEGYKHITEDIDSMLDQLRKQITRLGEISSSRSNTQTEYFQNDLILDNTEILSDTHSLASNFSLYSQSNTRLSVESTRSGKTAKSRRREERKRARGKKGSVFEEEYLLNSLKRLKERFNGMKENISKVLQYLAMSKNLEKARHLQSSYGELEKEIQKELDDKSHQWPLMETSEAINVTGSNKQPIVTHPNIEGSWKLEILDSM